MAKKTEENIQIAICKYLDLQYPNLIYTSDLSGIKLTIGQAVKAKAQRCKKYKIPDLLIFKDFYDSHSNFYSGLVIELKKSKSEVFGVKNQVLKNKHVEAQIQSLHKLKSDGYFATFAFGFAGAKKIIDDYMSGKLPYLIIDKI